MRVPLRGRPIAAYIAVEVGFGPPFTRGPLGLVLSPGPTAASSPAGTGVRRPRSRSGESVRAVPRRCRRLVRLGTARRGARILDFLRAAVARPVAVSTRSWTSSPRTAAAPGLADVLRDARSPDAPRGRGACGHRRPPWGDPAYPPLLATIPDAPFVLWLKGSPACFAKPTVAIVGSRAATPYGLEAASRLAGDLAAAGVVVVSGLARGVDSAAHRGALAAGGDTVAVLGSGVDVIYPPEHARAGGRGRRPRRRRVASSRRGRMPVAFHFPARNRIISGLSQAVVVVEAAERSGSLITAQLALEQGREVMAVPGSVLSGRHRGCHALIRDGAAVVETAEDVLAEMRASFLARPVPSSDRGRARPDPGGHVAGRELRHRGAGRRKPAGPPRNSCPGCSTWNCGGRSGGWTAADSFVPVERANVDRSGPRVAAGR